MVKFLMASTGPHHILYVDDDPDMRMLVKNTLENSNAMRVSVCVSAMEILEDTINSMPDLIILDVVMPVMDGKAILQEIKNDKRISHIPVIFLTSKSSEKEVQSLVNLGAIGVIAKPFELTTLAQQVSTLWQNATRPS
jgi:two-component system OmpR family response regulator